MWWIPREPSSQSPVTGREDLGWYQGCPAQPSIPPLHGTPTHRPKRGRRRTPERIAERLAAIDEQLATADLLNRLHLVQERMDLEGELAAGEGDGADLEELEAAFVEVAAAYGERKGLTYDAWRSTGVAPRVLKAAGIGRRR